MNIVFRVDSSIEMGIGHVMRCLTLADALRDEGEQCHFVCREHPGNVMDQIVSHGYQVYSLPLSQADQFVEGESTGKSQLAHAHWLGCDWLSDARQTMSCIGALNADWLVVDHYGLDERWEKLLRPACNKIMVIDDLADRHHDCDLLLDQTFGRLTQDYEGLFPAKCSLLTGAKFALLRPEFAELRDYSLQRRKNSRFENLLISMGGIDKDNATGKVLKFLKEVSLPRQCRITIVMGENAPWLDEVKSLAETLPWPAEVKANVVNMAQIMADSDLAIGAAGGTSWERCCMGLPSIVLSYAENQMFLAETLGRSGIHWYIGDLEDICGDGLRSAVKHASIASSSLSCLSINSSNICDGKGSTRVVRTLIGCDLELELATLDDADVLFLWRNDPSIRKHFFDSKEISIEEHLAWFENSLNKSDRVLLVAYLNKMPIGCLRFDLEDKVAEISIYLNPIAVGKGLGTQILRSGTKWLKKNYSDVENINALVLRDNVASQKAFLDAGYDLNCLKYVKQL